MKKKVVIVGAGPAGLTAAYNLLKKDKRNYEVTILERDSIIGGISKSVKKNGYIFDTGIHRFFSKNDEVNKIWNEILPIQNKYAYDDIVLKRKREFLNQGSDPELEDKSFLIRDRCTRILYNRKFFDYPVNLNFNTIKNLGFKTMIKAGFSYLKSLIIKLPEDNLENFYINRFGKVLYSMFFESYTEKVWGVHPSNISADWGSQRVKGVSISAVLKDFFRKVFHKKNKKNTETSLIEQFYYPKLGTGQMYEEMANKIVSLGGKIILNANVEKVCIVNNKVSKIKYSLNKEEYDFKCDYFLSSMPIKNLFESIDGVEIPKHTYDIAVNLPYRSFISVGILAKKINLENKTGIKTMANVIPDSWIYVQEKDVKMGRLQIFNNWSPYLFKDKKEANKNVLLTLEYFCDENDEYWKMSDKKFCEFAISEAIKLKLFKEKDVINSYRFKIPKAYPAYFGTYSEFDKVVKYLNKFDNLYCIGRNGQHRYNNMDHSMLTGIEATNNILNNKKDKKNVWNVNAEKEYHEEKK